MPWTIERNYACSRFLYQSEVGQELIGFQWELVEKRMHPWLHELSLIRKPDGQLHLIGNLSTTEPLSSLDDNGMRIPRTGVRRLRKIAETLQEAASFLFDEQQAVLDSETIRYRREAGDADPQIVLLFIPAAAKDVAKQNENKPLDNLINQIGAAYGWSETFHDAVLRTYWQGGTRTLLHFLSTHSDGELSAADKSVPALDADTSQDMPLNLSDGKSPGRSKDVPRAVKRGLRHAKLLIWAGAHLLALLLAVSPMFGSGNGFGRFIAVLPGLSPVPLLILPGLFLIVADAILIIATLRKTKKKERKTPVSKHKELRYQGSQTELVERKDEGFRMAMLSQHLPGTPEEMEGIRAFILLDEYLVGREETEVDLWLSSATVGRRHARINRREGSFFITDMGSRNGTFLNGRKLNRQEETLLPDRCRLQFADMSFYFQADSCS